MRYSRNSLAPHRLGAIPLAILLALLASLFVATPIYGSGDTVSLQITNGSSFPYGTCVNFKATLTLGTPLTGNYGLGVDVRPSYGADFGLPQTSESADKLTYIFSQCVTEDGNGKPLQVGDNITASAVFLNPETKVQTTSNTVTFSITRAQSSVDCLIGNSSLFMTPGTQVNIQANINQLQTSQGKQFTLTFTGPTTVTSPTLTANASGIVSAPAPSVYGTYKITCAFLGDSLYLGSKGTAGSITVSREQKLGGAQLYTSPTTLVANQPMQMYVMFTAASGGPAPNGYFTITVGQYSTAIIKVGSGGATLVKLNAIPRLPSPPSVLIWYEGDAYYNIQSFTFPGTNPPIPGSGGGGGGGGGGGSPATPTATGAAATGTATAGDSATPAASPTAAPAATGISTTGQSGNNLVLWLVGILGLLIVLGAGAGGAVYILRRRQASRIPM